jgi:hypothetical protein
MHDRGFRFLQRYKVTIDSSAQPYIEACNMSKRLKKRQQELELLKAAEQASATPAAQVPEASESKSRDEEPEKASGPVNAFAAVGMTLTLET